MTKTRVLTIAALAAALGIPATLGVSHAVSAASLPSHAAVAAPSQEGPEKGAEANESPNTETNDDRRTGAGAAAVAEAGETADAPEANEPAGPDKDNIQEGPGSTADGGTEAAR
ncbi:MAG: hypothetical protein NVS3B7_08370 [Candidatus Elarobacter sp.]